MPTVSVIIPTFDRCQFLRRALRSVEQQTFRDFELIVLDDGSTDGTLEFLNKYNPDFPFRWLKFDRKERSYLRNYAAEQATGHYLAFLDDDDEWLPQKLERQISLVTSNPEVALVHCFTAVIDETHQEIVDMGRVHQVHHDRAFKLGYTYETMTLECIIFTSTVMVRRDAFLRVGGFDPILPPLEDWDFYLRLSIDYQIAAIPEVLVRYRIHPNQSGVGPTTLSRIAVARKHLAAQTMLNGKGNFSNSSRVNLLIHVAEGSFLLGNHRSCRGAFFDILRVDPSVLVKPIWGSHLIFPHFVLSCLPERLGLWMRRRRPCKHRLNT